MNMPMILDDNVEVNHEKFQLEVKYEKSYLISMN